MKCASAAIFSLTVRDFTSRVFRLAGVFSFLVSMLAATKPILVPLAGPWERGYWGRSIISVTARSISTE